MSVFDVGFMLWGYFAVYVLVTIAYYVWLGARNRRDARTRATAAGRPGRRWTR